MVDCPKVRKIPWNFPFMRVFFSEDFHFYSYLDYYALITSVVMQGKALLLSWNYSVNLGLAPLSVFT
jgi:hypothetical protein